jgi:NAD(P)-dependent dehydrogenase (short-subunit alcohol dehydrogenase family)
MDRRLEGKVAIITGAGTGIGEAIAHKFAKEGAAVVVNGLPEDPIEDVAQKIKHCDGKAIAYVGGVLTSIFCSVSSLLIIFARSGIQFPTLLIAFL